MEIEIVTLVVKGSVKLIVPTDWQEQIQEGSRRVALRLVLQMWPLEITDLPNEDMYYYMYNMYMYNITGKILQV